MARLYMDIKVEETNQSGVWISCVAGATGIPGFYEIEAPIWYFFSGDPGTLTITNMMRALSIAAIEVETGVTLSSLTAVAFGAPVGL